MPVDEYIPVEVIRKNLAAIDAQLVELEHERVRILKQKRILLANQKVLAGLEQLAVKVPETSKTPVARSDPAIGSISTQVGTSQTDVGQSIPDGRVATPIILEMIRQRPGIKSIEVIDALHTRVAKRGNKSARKILGDLIWELGHRNKLRRQSDGSLFLVDKEVNDD
jgi:hypothetical protein